MGQCKGKTKRGQPCKNPVAKGRYCHVHKRWYLIRLSTIGSALLVIIGLIADVPGIFENIANYVYPNEMSGDFRIAIAGFADLSKQTDNLGYELAENVYLRLDEDLNEINPGLLISVWGPDKVGEINGEDPEIRAENAEKIADKLQADMVIYGSVDFGNRGFIITPEFYISANNYYEANEITGQHYFGIPFTVPGSSNPTDNPAWRYDFGVKMINRSKVIAQICVGLAYFALHEYSASLDIFQAASQNELWDHSQGKEVLLVLVAFAAGKTEKFDLAESALREAIDINADYTRPYIGMANLSYINATEKLMNSDFSENVTIDLLDDCFRYLEVAEKASYSPPLAETETKIHFSKGQCYFLKTYAGELPDFNMAVREFQQVISVYNDGVNPRVQELAAEAYARLGLIYDLLDKEAEAVKNYQIAAELINDIPERQEIFLARVQEINNR